MSKSIEGYFTCNSGVIWTVYSEGDEYTSNMDANIAITDSPDGTFKTVQVLVNDAGETLIDDEYVLWPSLIDLAVAIEA